jgi:hypothetical protein
MQAPVLPPFPMPLTLILLTTVAEPGTMLISNSGTIHLENETGVSMREGKEAEMSIRPVSKDTKKQIAKQGGREV